MSQSLRILIVEDDILIAMDLAELLIAQGHEICAAVETEREAVEAARNSSPGLIIVDAHLAEGCGISAMQTILSQGFVPHLYVSGDPRSILEMLPQAIVVDKPFTLHALEKAMTKACLQSALDQPSFA